KHKGELARLYTLVFSTGYVKVTNSKWHVTDCKMYQLKKERIQLCALFLDQLLKNEEMFL
ncbi:hypothetical protein ACPTJA_14270, partial [Enterococcus faecalis]|uniref:hypothetical protein n=1 Tax=Enterococcus TaxID=1350 RepID=UPI0011168EC8